MQILIIGLGGFAGSVLRYVLGTLVQRALPPHALPLGTLAVNVTGCLAIGIVAGLVDARRLLDADARAFLTIGLLGGFTTFSAFANETFETWRAGHSVAALAYVLVSVTACLLAVWLGRGMAAAWTA